MGPSSILLYIFTSQWQHLQELSTPNHATICSAEELALLLDLPVKDLVMRLIPAALPKLTEDKNTASMEALAKGIGVSVSRMMGDQGHYVVTKYLPEGMPPCICLCLCLITPGPRWCETDCLASFMGALHFCLDKHACKASAGMRAFVSVCS